MGQELIKLSHINKSYGDGKFSVPVLHDVSLSIEEGEYLSIMGPSGSGKSTLMNMIGCLDRPDSGEYTLAGENVFSLDDNGLSRLRNRTIGFVFQNFNLLPRETALENVALPLLYAGVARAERLERAREVLEGVGLSDRVEFYPTQLSGGQKQRVAIARAMVNRPRVLLADEPTGALDSASGRQVMEIFQRLNDVGVTIVMITHAQEIADRARRTIHIFDGEVRE
jgi:putative ABC transport system ATP-binding protein